MARNALIAASDSSTRSRPTVIGMPAGRSPVIVVSPSRSRPACTFTGDPLTSLSMAASSTRHGRRNGARHRQVVPLIGRVVSALVRRSLRASRS